ncbi:MAG: MMPL family transporter [Planctomycetes bacterium]|nr:MMPL family transporter [Planctomycetota bacterium]
MTALIVAIFDFARRRRLVLPLICAAVLSLACIGIAQIKFTEDVFELLPQNEPAVAEGRLVLARFRTLERIIISLKADEQVKLLSAIDNTAAELRNAPGIRSVVSRLNDHAMEDIAQAYDGKLPMLFDAPMQRAVEQRLTAEEFQLRLQRFADRQAGAEGITVDSAKFRRDPFAMDEMLLRRFERLNAGFNVQLIGGRLVSKDGLHGLIIAEAEFPALNTGRGIDLIAGVDRVLAGLPPGVSGVAIGGHRSSVDNALVLRNDIQWTILTSVLGVLAIFILAYRSLTPIIATLLSVGVGFGAALGVQGWTVGALSAITAGFSAALLGISVDYTVHLVTAMGGEAAATKPQRVRDALRHVALPTALAMVTTVVAMATLWFSRFDGLKQLAAIATIGVTVAFVFAFTVGAQFLAKVGPRPKANLLVNVVRGAGRLRERARVPILVGALIVTLGLGYGLSRVQIDGDVRHLDGSSRAAREAEADVNRVYGGNALTRTLVVSRGDDLEGALRANDLAAREIDKLGVTRFEGLSWVLPARDTQRENIARWRRFWTNERVAALKEAMLKARANSAGKELTFTAAKCDAFFADFFARLSPDTPDGALIDPTELRQRPLWDLLRNYASEADGGVYVATTAELAPELTPLLRAGAPSAMMLNKTAFAGVIVGFVQRDLIVLGGLSLALVVFLLWLTFGEIGAIAAALTPVGGSLIWTLGLMGLLGIQFNIINTLVTVFIAGLGIDYGIFVVQIYREAPDAATARERMASAGGGIAAAAITTLFGFGSLAIASHPALFSVGITTTIGITSSLILALFVTPSLVARGGGK